MGLFCVYLGLDPAALCFQGMPTMVRLDPSDAVFVDVIHSNAGQSISTGNCQANMNFPSKLESDDQVIYCIMNIFFRIWDG